MDEGYNLWLFKCKKIDLDKVEFDCPDTSANSILIQNEFVTAAIEYELNKLLIYATKDFLIANDWQVVKTITDLDTGNIEKHW